MRAIPIDSFLDTEDSMPGGAPEDWRALVRAGRSARAASDGGSWRIGSLAGTVERRYASGALKRFSDEIGESFGSVRRFRWVAGAYDDAARARFSELSFSHFQAVAGLTDRLVWLERAMRGAWSVDRLTTQSRARASNMEPLERLRAPIASAKKALARFDTVSDRELAKAARAGLAEDVDELAAQVDRLRSRMASVKRSTRSLKVARAR